jgi:hypothetical protein
MLTGDASVNKFQFACPVCGGQHGDAVRKVDRDGRPRWLVSCWDCQDACTSERYLRALIDAVGAPNGGALLHDPPRYLGHLARNESGRAGSSSREPALLPSHAALAGWHSRLLSESRPLGYLLTDRGLSLEIIRRNALGWDGEAFALPVADVRTGEIVNLRRRRWPQPWPDGSRYRGLRGRGSALYPSVPTSGPLLLCAGEFDALVGRRHGLPAFTSTSGSGTRWRAEWNDRVVGRRVAVVFDADPREEAQAESRAAQLREAGADAWAVRLSRTGLGPKQDLTDWFVTHRRSATDLRVVVNRARRQR